MTTTRLYLSLSAAPDVSPAYDGGSQAVFAWATPTSGAAVRAKLLSAKSASESLGQDGFVEGTVSVGGNARFLMRQYVSDTLAAQTISGTLRGYICANAHVDVGQQPAGKLYVVSSDGSTARGTLWDGTTDVLPTNEWNRSPTFGESATIGIDPVSPPTIALNPVTLLNGDRLVFEIGWKFHYNGSTGPAGCAGIWGAPSSGTDFTTDGQGENGVPWIEFSIALIAYAPPPSQPTLPDTRGITAAHLAAMRRAGVRPVVMATIEPVTWGSKYTAVSGGQRLFGIAPSIVGLTPIKSLVDIATKRHTIGSVQLEFKRDGTVRKMIRDFVIFGAKVTLKIGAPDLALADFDWLGVGTVTDANPTDTGHLVQVDLSATGLAFLQMIVGHWEGDHPLDLVANILGTRNGIPSDLWISEAFDSTNVAYAAFSHYGAARTGRVAPPTAPGGPWWTSEITEPTDSLELIQSLAQLLPGTILPNRKGELRFRTYDPTRGAVRKFSARDIIEIKQTGTYGALCNQSTMSLSGEGTFLPEWARAAGQNATVYIKSEDQPSQLVVRYPGMPKRVVAESIVSPWLNGASQVELQTSIDVTTLPGTLRVSGLCCKYGFAGCFLPVAQRVQGGTVPANRQLNPGAGRYAYLMINTPGQVTNDQRAAGHPEVMACNVVRCTAAALHWGDIIAGGNASAIDEYGYQWPAYVEFTFDQVGLASTNAAFPQGGVDTTGMAVFDVTIPYEYTQREVARRKLGVPTVRVRVNLGNRDLEPEDQVQLDDDAISSLNMDGANSDTLWEIIGVEEDPLGDSPGIWFDLAWSQTVQVASIYQPTVSAVVSPKRLITSSVYEDSQQGSLQARVAAATDYNATFPGGLAVQVAPGAVRGNGAATGRTDTQTITLPASRQVFLYQNLMFGCFRMRDFPLATAAPTPYAGDVLLHEFATSGVGITTSIDHRSAALKVLHGSKLVDSTVDRAQLNSPVSKDAFDLSNDASVGSQYERKSIHELTTTNATAAIIAEITIPEKTSAVYEVTACGRQTTKHAGFISAVHVYRDSGGNATAVGAASLFASAGTTGYALSFDVTATTLRVYVTGAAAETVKWAATVKRTHVTQ